MLGHIKIWKSSFSKPQDSNTTRQEQSNIIHFRPYAMVKRRKTRAASKKMPGSNQPR